MKLTKKFRHDYKKASSPLRSPADFSSFNEYVDYINELHASIPQDGPVTVEDVNFGTYEYYGADFAIHYWVPRSQKEKDKLKAQDKARREREASARLEKEQKERELLKKLKLKYEY